MAKCVAVEKAGAEKLRRKLVSEGLMNFDYVPCSDERCVYFPVKKSIKGFRVVDRSMKKTEKKFSSLAGALAGKLSKKEAGALVGAYDIIGKIAVLEIPEALEKKEKVIANALMGVHRNVETVAKKEGAVRGVFRLRKVKVIAGRKNTETEHVESGCRLGMDVAKAYFSPRLAFERQRIAGMVKKGEKVMVFFAGVGPYAIVIAKKQPLAKIVAIELNPAAFRYLERNVARNGMSARITPILGDVRKVAKEFKGWADRIVMPLPKGAEEFLDEAFIAAGRKCTVHFYQFVEEKGGFEEAERNIMEAARRNGRKARITGKRVVRQYAPHIVQVAVDFRVV